MTIEFSAPVNIPQLLERARRNMEKKRTVRVHRPKLATSCTVDTVPVAQVIDVNRESWLQEVA